MFSAGITIARFAYHHQMSLTYSTHLQFSVFIPRGQLQHQSLNLGSTELVQPLEQVQFQVR